MSAANKASTGESPPGNEKAALAGGNLGTGNETARIITRAAEQVKHPIRLLLARLATWLRPPRLDKDCRIICATHGGEMSIVEEILRQLGPCVLLSIPPGEKGPRLKGWQNLTRNDMRADYLTGLNHGNNIGVLLGAASEGLCKRLTLTTTTASKSSSTLIPACAKALFHVERGAAMSGCE